MPFDQLSDSDFNEDSPITLQEAGWMVSRLSEDFGLTHPGDPSSETLGHALSLWREVHQKLEEGDVVTERPTPPLEYI